MSLYIISATFIQVLQLLNTCHVFTYTPYSAILYMFYKCQVFTDSFVKTVVFCVSLHHVAVNVPKCTAEHCFHLQGDLFG